MSSSSGSSCRQILPSQSVPSESGIAAPVPGRTSEQARPQSGDEPRPVKKRKQRPQLSCQGGSRCHRSAGLPIIPNGICTCVGADGTECRRLKLKCDRLSKGLLQRPPSMLIRSSLLELRAATKGGGLHPEWNEQPDAEVRAIHCAQLTTVFTSHSLRNILLTGYHQSQILPSPK